MYQLEILDSLKLDVLGAASDMSPGWDAWEMDGLRGAWASVDFIGRGGSL